MMQHLHEMTEEQRREFLLQSKVAAGSIMHEVGIAVLRPLNLFFR